MLFLEEVRERLTVIALEESDYVEVLRFCESKSIAGGAIYDAAIAYCAAKANFEALYTWNVSDFQRVAPKALRVAQPPTPEQAGGA